MKTLLLCFGLSLVLVPWVGGQGSLKDVGDIGTVVDSQGVALVRGKVGTRWTAAAVQMPVKPGDWLRTDVRGANALQVRMADGGGMILGPGTLVEVTDGKTLTLVRGEVEVTPGKNSKVTVNSGAETVFALEKGTVLRRLEGKEGVVLDKEPNWLKGFKGAVVSESMGQLVATVDGRNTPLTLGYHKVSVDIRDQIARTTIEESFVNHTESRLEGIFYFPLPQDASISGFGMWINDELVEADVVEKQRAREIYETILREKRDPGLLEWTGGNLFKARVFPIFGHSEKRIKITYTQVLPFRKGSYRYSYALQSEMLKANPLRELSVNVRVSSALPIQSFACTSHDARVSQTEHAAQAEFTAQEYTPGSDFEVEIGVDQKASPVTVIPHRRGEDGYFLALVTPPGEGGEWEREMVGDGEPLELVILADTSGSMDAAARASQDALLGALLGSLGPKDSFRLATCDTEVRWFDGKDVEGARDFLAGRVSLGWSDLDKAFAAAMEVAKENAHVIYIGDGVVTTGDGDPVAFANRLKQMYGEKGATFHAVAPTSSYEPGVLKAIASLGGGSVRRISGSDTPAAVATKLLGEISSPGIRDMEISFRGMRVARVYPEVLPNLAEGKQQIVIGRYLPEGKDQRGEILIKGMRGGKPVEFRTEVELKDAESGNSFIPRLWAREHLDVLLEQGRTPEVKEDVIALSEEFNIMTPYTSFLVLESDADRERFKVKRRFRMRDGEKFFADGRDAANYELLQQQMRLAGTWRVNLQSGFLRELGTLGRTLYPSYPADPTSRNDGYALGGATESRGYPREEDEARRWESGANEDFKPGDTPLVPQSATPDAPVDDYQDLLGDAEKLSADPKETVDGESDGKDGKEMDPGDYAESSGGSTGPAPGMNQAASQGKAIRELPYPSVSGHKRQNEYFVGYEEAGRMRMQGGDEAKHRHGEVRYGQDGWHWIHYLGDLESLFPAAEGSGYAVPDRTGHPWPVEAQKLADSLLRVEKLGSLEGKGGVDVRVKVTYNDVRFERVSSEWGNRILISGDRWLAVSGGDRTDVVVNWATPEERGVFGKGFRLGRVRKSAEGDRLQFPLGLNDGSMSSLADARLAYEVKVVEAGAGRARLILTVPNSEPKQVETYEIDTERNVLLSSETKVGDAVTARTDYSDFVEAGGMWWAGKVTVKDADGKVTREDVIDVRDVDGDALDVGFEKGLTDRGQVLFLEGDLPEVEDAKKAAAEGKGRFESELVLLQHFALSQQWERAAAHFEKMEALAGKKPGFGWLEIRFLGMQRRNEEVKVAVQEAAKKWMEKVVEGEFAVVSHLRTEGGKVMAANEQHELLELVKPVFARLPEHAWGMKEWKTAWMWSLQNIGRPDEALAAAEELAGEYGWDANVQTQYANMLSNRGDGPKAVAYCEKLLGQEHWNGDELFGFRNHLINQLESLSQVEEIRKHLEEVIEADPDHTYSWVYERYLSALVRTEDVERAYELTGEWIGAAMKVKEGERLEVAARARLDAALGLLFGNAYGVSRETIEERFHAPLVKLVRRFALDKGAAEIAERVMGDYRFAQTEAARDTRAHFIGVLTKRAGELPLVELNRLTNWAMQNNPVVEKGGWEGIVAPLIARWSAEKDILQRDQWSGLIGRILSGYVGAESYADFLRRQLEEGPESERARYAGILFEHLIGAAWSEGAEREAFDLLYVMTPVLKKDNLEAVVLQRAWALLRLNDWVTNHGYAALYGAVEKKEELSRTELAEVEREKQREISEHLSERLGAELLERDGLEPEFAHWLNIEKLYVDVKLGGEPAKAVAAECWEFLGNFDFADKEEERSWGEVALIGRFLDTLEYLAAKQGADGELVKRVLEFHDAGIEANPEDPAWKLRKYRMLVALDMAQELKESLRAWVAAGGEVTRWRVALGYLLAELNEIDGAILEFEAVEKADELRPHEYRVLADWYLVRDKKEKREAALAGYYGTIPDYQLSNLISQRTAEIRTGFENGVPEDLDPEVVTMLTVLLRKTQQPASYIHQLGELYRYTKDFRLLECVPEGIIGHTALSIYPYLQSLVSVHEHIRDEATADSIFAQMEAVRGRALTAVDARGMDLLEMLVRRKASEVLNQPGQHLPKALAAMQRAFDRGWEDGERKLMAGFLYSLGNITQGVLADEQLREMAELHREEKADADRMEVGHYRGQLLWNYEDKREEAIEVLEFVLVDIEDASGGVMPYAAQNVLGTYVSYLAGLKRYAGAEKEILRILEQKLVRELHHWLVNRKYQLYIEALANGGAVSIGKGETLYVNAAGLMLAELPEVDHELRHGIVQSLCNLYWGAHRLEIKRAAGDAKEFAYGAFDELVPFATLHYQSLVTALARVLFDSIGPVEGLAFLIDRFGKEPDSFRATGVDGWRSYGSTMADYRLHAAVLPGGIGKLEPRLLEIVLAELKRDLLEQQNRGNGMYWGPANSYFWQEKKADFLRVAEEVIQDKRGSMQILVYAARYLHDGLGNTERAIAVLEDAYKRKLLDENGWALLVSYLEYAGRWKDVVIYLEPLVEFRPDNLNYRTRLMTAYFNVGEQGKLVAALDAIDARWHEKGWWNEGTVGAVATVCFETARWDRAVGYFDELIPMYQRARPNRGVGDGTLSHYYGLLAQCHQKLGNTPAAVEAVSGAIVTWGSDMSNRAGALSTLVQVLKDSGDLEGYVAVLDKQVEETGLENPIVRKALGRVYLDLGKAEQAVFQLKLAVEAQPNDAETHRALVEAFDMKKDEAGAVAQLLDSARLSGREIGLFKELGERYEKLGNKNEAERARTNMVEALPNESEGHAALAEAREVQELWGEAISHWEQVAEIRALEPTGLQRLAAAQKKAGDAKAAAGTLKKLLEKNWPSRFGDVHGEAQRELVALKNQG